MNREEIAKSEEMSMHSVPFPEVVAKLAKAGVETYYADLVRLEKVFYGAEGESHAHKVPLANAQKIAPQFSESEVRGSLAAIQSGQTTYPEFLHRIMRAGTLGYLVFIAGRRVVYFGRDGQYHVELFPSAKP